MFLDRYGPSPEEVRRARGWALYVALVMVESGDPAHEHLGHAALDRLLLPEQ